MNPYTYIGRCTFNKFSAEWQAHEILAYQITLGNKVISHFVQPKDYRQEDSGPLWKSRKCRKLHVGKTHSGLHIQYYEI